MTNNDENELLELATKAAISAGQKILSYAHPIQVEFKSDNTNPITDADKLGETVIKNIIMQARPNDGIIGEEGTNIKSKTGLRWVFDPLDGTINYIYKIPHWAVSISCEEFDGWCWKPKVGVIYDIARNEIFSAIKNNGAVLNDSKIAVNEIKDFSEALLSTEYSYNRRKRLYQTKIMSDLLLKVRDIRSCGSSVLDLCWVACGRFDGFYENELSPWDWSAGSLIVQEAGGIITPLGTGIIASPQLIHKKLCQFVKR
ncbi:MAG: inositol monophosphatase family protein [Candidatus Paracaedibacteraceae bacterium]|nr:inositol monophosphatase family protein [Candidatus Paracaedibacteraceae bacterium]